MEDNFDLSNLKPPKKRINSRSKGSAFERKICNLFNSTFETKEFCRTPGSGAFATTHKLPEHLKIHGDIITPENFKYTIECKKGYNKENLSSLFSSNSKINIFINQAKRDSIKTNKPFMLIWQQDRSDILCILDKHQYPSYLDFKSLIYKDYIIVRLKDLLKAEINFWFN
jgi:Holliday junction resolvase